MIEIKIKKQVRDYLLATGNKVITNNGIYIQPNPIWLKISGNRVFIVDEYEENIYGENSAIYKIDQKDAKNIKE